jgi:hypothetical protein
VFARSANTSGIGIRESGIASEKDERGELPRLTVPVIFPPPRRGVDLASQVGRFPISRFPDFPIPDSR